MATVSFGSVTGGTRRVATQIHEALARAQPGPEECGAGLQWQSVDHWEETTMSDLIRLGATALEGGDAQTANKCYARAYEIASQPAPPRKDPFDPDPEPPRRAKMWPTEVQCRSALCAGNICLAVEEDPSLLATGTVAAVRAQLTILDSLTKEAVAETAVDAGNSWLLYNLSVRIYCIVVDVLERGLAGPALASLLPPLLSVAAAVDGVPVLCVADYAGWRVQLATAICRAFEAIGQPHMALRFCHRLNERLQQIENADDIAAATNTLAVVQYRYAACADSAAVDPAALETSFPHLGARFGAIVEGLNGLATPSNNPPEATEEGEEPPKPQLGKPGMRRRILDRAAPDEASAAAVTGLIEAARALALEHFPATEPTEDAEAPAEGEEAAVPASVSTPTHTCSDEGKVISLQSHAAVVKWCFGFAQDDAFDEMVPALRWRLLSAETQDEQILALELEVLSELHKCFSGAVFEPDGVPVAFADALYALAEAQTRAPGPGCSDLIYDGSVLLWEALKNESTQALADLDTNGDAETEAGADDEALRGGPVCHCLLVTWKCLAICRADDAMLCSTVALRLATAWEACSVGDPKTLQLATEVAERGIAQLEDARSKFIDSREIDWVLSTARADGTDELYQRLCCIHVELLNKMFQLKLLQGRERAREAAERGYNRTMAALKKRQGLQPLYGMRTEKQAEAESLALSRPAPRPSFCPKTERELTKYCGQNTYQQALLLGQMARFRDTPAERAPLLTRAVELLVNAERKESMAAEHWQDVAAEADQNEARTKYPIAPILVSRTHNSITVRAPEFHLTKATRFWALYGKEAGAGTACAMTNTELAETGQLRETSNLGTVTVTGLNPNEAYVFATAGFGGAKKVVHGIGQTCIPIVAMHPLPVKLCQGVTAVLAYELGCATPAKKALRPLRTALIVKAPRSAPSGVSETGRAACKLPGLILDHERAVRCNHSELRAFSQALLLSVSPPGTDFEPYAVTKPPKSKEARELSKGPQEPQLSMLNEIRTLLISLEAAASVPDDELAMQVAVTLKEFLAPVVDARQAPAYLLPAIARSFDALAKVAPESLCPAADADDEITSGALAARKAVCTFAVDLIKMMMETHSTAAANEVVKKLIALVSNSTANFKPADPPADGAGESAQDSASPWTIGEWDAVLNFMLMLPADIVSDDELRSLMSIRSDKAEHDSLLAEMWIKFREGGAVSAIEAARELAGEDKSLLLRHASYICETALQNAMVIEAKEVCESILAEATTNPKCVDLGGERELFVLPDIQIHLPPAEEEEEAVDETELDDDATAELEAARKAKEEQLQEEKRQRAASYLQASLRLLHTTKTEQREFRKKIRSEQPWRASLELTLAQAEFVEWRNSGADPGTSAETTEGGNVGEDGEAAAEEMETEDVMPPWLGFLNRASRAVVLASRCKNWVQVENACRTLQNLASWVRQELPQSAGVDCYLDSLVKESAANCVVMLQNLKHENDRQLEEDAAAALAGDRSAISSSGSSSMYWFTGFSRPDVAWVASHVVWCLQLCLVPKPKAKKQILPDGSLKQHKIEVAEFGAVADLGSRLNYVTEDFFAEEVLPMIIKAKDSLGEDSRNAKERLAVVLRDKPMAQETLDLVRDEMHKHKTIASRHPQIVSKFGSAIQLLRDKRETLLVCQALNELGDFHWEAGRAEEAAVAWTDGVDGAFGVYAALSEWRDTLEGQDGGETSDAALLKRYGIMECILAVTMLGKLAKYAYTGDTLLRVESCRFAARIVHIMFSCDVTHPHKLREFSRYRLRQLWEGVDIFRVPEICSGTVFLEALDTVCTELDTAGVLLPALPVLALYQHVAVDALRNLFHALCGAITRARVLTKAGYLAEASLSLKDVATGSEMPGVEALPASEGFAPLRNELPPQSEENLASIESICASVLPELPATVLSEQQRDFVVCNLALAQEALRVRLATSTGEEEDQVREQLLAASEARLIELRDSRTGAQPEDESETSEASPTHSPLDTRTRSEADLVIATIQQQRLLHDKAVERAVAVLLVMKARIQEPKSAEGMTELRLNEAQKSHSGSDLWLRCRQIVVDCFIASRRFPEARQVCFTMRDEAEAVNDVVQSCKATSSLAAIDALTGDPEASLSQLESVSTTLRKLNLLDQTYAEILMRIAELHDKAGRPSAAVDYLWKADAVLKSLATGDDGTAGFGVITGTKSDFTCLPAPTDELPIGHSLYLPPALPWARVHSALGHLASTQADIAAADSHLAFAAFLASTGVCSAPAIFRASLCLALGKQARRKIDPAGVCGGIFLPEPDEAEAEAAAAAADPDSEDAPAKSAEHPLSDQVKAQLAKVVEVLIGESGHQHALIRQALLEMAILHGQRADAAGLRTAAHMLRKASSVADMEGALAALMSAIPGGAAVSNLPEFLAADLVASRQADDAGSAEDRPVTTTDLIQYYCSVVAEQETAGVGSGLAVDTKLSRVHKFSSTACPSLKDVFLSEWPEADAPSPVEQGAVCVQWYGTDPKAPDPFAMPSEKEDGRKHISLAERLGLPGSLPPTTAPANAPSTVLALLLCGPVPPVPTEEPLDDDTEDPSLKQAQLRCYEIDIAEARRVHRNLVDLLFQMKEDALHPPTTPEEGAPVDPAVARKQEITLAFFTECVSDVRSVLAPFTAEVAGAGSAAAPLEMSVETVSTLASLMDASGGGTFSVDEATCRMLRAP